MPHVTKTTSKPDSGAWPSTRSLNPAQVVAVVDRREQRPLDLTPLANVPGTLPTGDYSVRGLERVVAVERKSLPDLVACVGRHRRRFEREVGRLLAYPVRALVVEASWSDIECGRWRGRVTPATVRGSLVGWIASGLPVITTGDRATAGPVVARLLYVAARRRYGEARGLLDGLIEAVPDEAATGAPQACTDAVTSACPG